MVGNRHAQVRARGEGCPQEISILGPFLSYPHLGSHPFLFPFTHLLAIYRVFRSSPAGPPLSWEFDESRH